MIGSIGCAFKRISRFVSVSRLGLALAISTAAALLPASATGQTATAGTTPLVFTNAAVGVSSTSAQKLTETFTLTGYSTVLAPTATMNYGLSYKIGAVACTGAAGNQTCTVSVTFLPTYPGGRKDAIFLMNGSTRLATVLVYGIGTAPFALLQPGVVTSPALHTNNYIYGSVSDENGTVYLVQQGGNQILQVTSAGVVSVVPVTGLSSPRELGIDGAGVMYIADQKSNSAITTFDLVQGIQGTFPWPTPSPGYIQTVAVGNEGTVYEADFSNIYVFAPGSTTATTVPISPGVTQPLYIDVDDQEDIFILGYTLNELPFGGTQKVVGTGGEIFGMGIDAAETLYFQGPTPGVGEYPASNYNASEAIVDAGASVLGASVQANGNVDVSNYAELDVVDRSQSTVAFGNQQAGISATGQMVQLYNGGNETLTVSAVTMSGSPAFSLNTPTSTTCKAGATVAPGAFCQVQLEFLSADPGSFTGSLVFTTNSLNNTTSTSTVTFSATITGAYMVPSPTTLDFGSVVDGTTSVTKTITLTNDGAGYAASVYSPASTDPAFTVTLGTCNVNIAVGDSCTLNVTFSPTAVQPYSATGSAGVTNAGPGDAPSVSFTLTGTGVPATLPPPPPVANLQFTPAIINITAGTGTSGYAGDNGLATAAELQGPNGLTYDTAGNLYISDAYNNRVRKVDTSGTITTFAGNGTPGDSGDNGAATSAEINRPAGLAFDAAGNLYIADSFNNVIRMVTPGGTITTFAGTGAPSYTGDGHAATAATFNEPLGLAFDAAGNLYIGDSGNHVVRMINTSGIINTFAGNGTSGYTGDGHAATAAELSDAEGVAVDSAGNVYIADSFNFVYRVVNKAGVISTFAGTGTKLGGCPLPGGNVPTTCTFSFPYTVYVSPGGDVYLGDEEGTVSVVDKTNTMYTYESRTASDVPANGKPDSSYGATGISGLTMDQTGNLMVASQNENEVTTAGSVGAVNFYEPQNVYTTATEQYVQLLNPGSAALTFSGTPTVTGPFATTTDGTCDFTKGLAAGASCSLGVTFTPTADGTATGAIVIDSNATTSPSTVQLSGTGQGTPTLTSTLAPTSLTFTAVANTTSPAQTLVFTNTGPAAISITSITITPNSGFAETNNCGTSLAAGAYCTISATFSPTAATTYSAGIYVTSDTSTFTPTINLNGTGTAAAAPTASLSPTTLAFPNTTTGSTATAMSTTLSNTGNATLNISGITLSDTTDFAKTTTCGSTLAAGKTCTISVTFTPAAAQAYTATLSVADDATGSPQTVTLSGTGNGGVMASPTSLNMGSETEYTENYTPQYITLTNNTSATITFSNFQSADVAEFYSQAYTCADSGVLLGNSSCQISVRFSPLSVGPITSSITMPYTGGGGGTLVVQLSGTGTAGTPAIDLYPLPVTFGQLPVLTAATPITLQVEDTGYAPLTGISFSITGANASDYTETDTCSGVTIDPYPGTGSCNVTVNFTPTGAGARIATLNVTSNSGAATFSTPLQGAGVAQPPQLQFTPTQLNLIAGAGGPCADATSGTATAATLCNITGTTQDYLGNTYLVDNTYNVVYKVDTTGAISVFAGTPSKTGGYAGDNGPATSATLSGPTAVAADAFGDIFISDTANSAIREVDTTGMITSFADSTCYEGGRGTPMHQAAATKAGKVHPHYAQLCQTFQPEGLVVDSLGNLIFADTLNNVVDEVGILSGNVSVVAGDADGLAGPAGYNGDGIKATTAELNGPQDVAVDPAGNIYIADTLNYRVRMVTAATGLISTIAGNGTQGDTGDGAAATSAEINAYGVSTDLAGDLFITPGTGGIVRKVDATGNINVFAGNGTGAIGGPASTGAVTNAYFARLDNSGDLLIPTGLQLLEAGPDGLLQFGSEPIGSTTAALTATVENTGDSNLSITSTGTTITGADAADFAVTSSTCGTSLAPGKTCALSVTFTPSATGARTASVSVGSNAAGSPQTVLLQGNGSTASAPAASLSPTTLSFPSTAVGSTAAAMSTTLSNTGTATLNISGITITGANPSDFAITTSGTACGTTLAAGSTCTISATFTPAAAASYTASISVADNATGSPQTATLSGTGTAAPVPLASLSPTTLAFPATTAGSTAAALSTTLSNTGNATLTITGITITGANTADFAITTTGTTCGATLAAGSTCTIAATFTPAAAGSFTATISVADNAASSPQTATLTGTGNTPPATDFTLTATPPAKTVAPGAVAQFTVNTTGVGGDFDSAIQLTATGLPSGFTATFNPASVTPGANGASSVLSIQTTSPLALAQPHPQHRGPWLPASLAALLVVPLLGLRKRIRKFDKLGGIARTLSVLLLLAGSLAPVLMLTGCSGGYYSVQTQTYTVTVTGTSGSTTHSTTVTLTVQQ